VDDKVRLWVDPKYADLMDILDGLNTEFERNPNMAVCAVCQGVGRIIYKDSDGKMKDIPCDNCQGSGEK